MYNLSDSLRVKIHQEYFQTILYRDLIERYDIPHPKALRDLAYQLIDNDASFSRSNANPKKIYCIDHAMVRSISSGILINSGHVLENLIFSTIRRKTANIFYYKTATGKEVDFIVLMNRAEKKLIQVCETMLEEKTRKRELSALQEAMTEQQLSEGTIVTKHETETIQTEVGIINIIPAWKFLFEW